MKFNIKNIFSDKFIRGTFILTLVTFLSSVLNYLVHPILTRHLSVAQYGTYQALLSFLTIFGVANTVVLTTLTKEFSVLAKTAPQESDSLRRRASSYLFFFGLIIYTIVWIFSGALNSLFQISNSSVLVLAALTLLYSFPLFVNRALITGRQEFTALSLSNFLDALSRLVFVIIFVVLIKLGLVGAALAVGLTSLAAFVWSYRQIRREGEEKREFFWSFKSLIGYASLVLWFTTLSQFFYNFDMLFVKAIMTPDEAGLYGALLTIGRIIFFIGGAVPLVMFPVIANLKDDKSLRRHGVLIKSVGLMAILAVPATLFISLLPNFTIRLIVGVKYQSIAPNLPLMALAMLLLTFLTILSQYFLALGKRRGLMVLTMAALAEIIALMIFKGSIRDIIYSLCGVFGGASIVLIILFSRDYRAAKGNLYGPEV